MEKLNKIEERVAEVLKSNPDTRNNDRLLIKTYLNTYHYVFTFQDYFNKKNDCPTTESIRRTRQKIQARGEYQSDKQIAKFRKQQEELFHDYSVQ